MLILRVKSFLLWLRKRSVNEMKQKGNEITNSIKQTDEQYST